MRKAEVIEIVRDHLGKHKVRNTSIDVVEEGVRREGRSWLVPVRPQRQLLRRCDYYEALIAVEDEVKAQAHLNVLLVPSA